MPSHEELILSLLSSNAHVTVLLEETVQALLPSHKPLPTCAVFIDATFGRGGHSRLLLSQLPKDARLFGFDKDPDAIAVGHALHREDARFTPIHASFADLTAQLHAHGITQVQGIMADLGVSSPQLDNAARGFSFLHDGPIDMRMDNSQGITAKDWLMHISAQELADALYIYGEERHSHRIAAAIKANISTLHSTLELAEVIKKAHPRWEKNKHPATRAFQAIRIAMNHELDDLQRFLPQAVQNLAPTGRLAIISFHSLEDRIVKQFIQHESNPNAQHDGWLMPNTKQIARLKKIDRISPSTTEIAHNNRARSAWLRIAERC